MKAIRILMVEDEMIVAMDIEERIARMGYELAGHATTGQTAINLTMQLRPDVVLMDIRLQGSMDGITAGAAIYRCCSSPVIFLTAHSDDETLARAKLVSPYSYLIKPFKDSDLKSAIEIAHHKYGADREINRLTRLLDVLGQVNNTVLHCRSREELFAAACRLVVERGKVNIAWIGWHDPATTRITPVASFGDGANFLAAADFWADGRPEGQANPGKAVREGRPSCCNECRNAFCPYPIDQKPARFGFQSCGTFPLRFRGEVWGAISLCNAEPHFFQEGEIRLMDEVALAISFALDKIDADARALVLMESVAAERERTDNELRQINIQLEQRVIERTENLSREIAERKLAESALQIKNLVFDASLAATSIADLDGILTEANEAFVKLWGYPGKAEVIGKSIMQFLANSDEAATIITALNKTGQWEGEYLGEKADGSHFEAFGMATVVRNGAGKLIGYQSAVLDISRERQTAMVLQGLNRQLEEALTRAKEMTVQAEAATVAKGRFLANMSHEIRTPLTALIGYSQLLQADSLLTAGQRQRVEAINRSGEHLLALLNDVLEISKINAGSHPLTQVTFDLPAVLRDMEIMFRSRADAKQLTLETVGLDQIPRYIVADEKKLRQILINLIGNAVKFTEAGFVRLRTWADPEGAMGLRLVIEIADSGIGISPEEMARLFEFFEQTSSGRHEGHGSGLGLAISRQFARLMGGDVSVASTSALGSTFRLEIVVTAGVAAAVAGLNNVRRVRQLDTGQPRYRILIVDDTADTRCLFGEILRSVGFDVCEATSGREAVVTTTSQRPDLVLMDYEMPGMDGGEAIRQIRRSPDGARTKIIMVTASATEEVREQSRLAGADEFIAKPFHRDILLDRIRVLIGVRYLYTELGPKIIRAPGRAPVLSQAALAILPAELREQIFNAALRSHHDHLLPLIEQVAAVDLELSENLRTLVAQFDYEALIRLFGVHVPT